MLLVTISRISLAVLNFLTFIFGLALVVVGIVLKFKAEEVMAKALELAPSGSSSIEPEHLKRVADGIMQEKQMFSLVAGGAISLGTFIIILSLLGFIGLVVRQKVILLSYIALMSLMVIINISFLIAFIMSKSKVETHIKSTIATMAKRYLKPYNEITKNNDTESSSMQYTFTKTINTFHVYQNCCFFQKPEELANMEWKKEVLNNLYLPLGCCKRLSEQPSLQVFMMFKNDTMNPFAVQCTSTATNYNTKSCSKILANQVKGSFNPIIGLLSVGITFELLCIVIAIISLPSIEV